MTKLEDRRLCIHCKWIVQPENESLQCSVSYLAGTNPVDGTPAKVYCGIERASYGRCGPGGAFWEPKQ